ncbi:hypothetical protein LXL04_034406 [Taraxacum kok-saghyz]
MNSPTFVLTLSKLMQSQNKGQEDVKSNLHGELKSLSDKLNHDKSHENSQEFSVFISSLEEKIGMFMVKLRNDLSNSFTNEIQEMVCKLKALHQKNPIPTLLPTKGSSCCIRGQYSLFLTIYVFSEYMLAELFSASSASEDQAQSVKVLKRLSGFGRSICSAILASADSRS